jgi:hypothetical protein
MNIYALTEWGRKLARSTTSPDTPGWRIVHYLDKVGQSTVDQIAAYTGLPQGQAGRVCSQLASKGILQKVG